MACVVSAYLLLLVGAGSVTVFLSGAPSSQVPPRITMEVIAFSTTVLPSILYFSLQEGGSRQATWGKRRAGLRLRWVAGGPVSYPRAFVRNALKFAPWQIAHSSMLHIPGWPFDSAAPSGLALGGLVAAWGLVFAYLGTLVLTPSRRTLYDRLSGTVVTPADP